MDAVSARRILLPKETDLNPFSMARPASFFEKPPSGPTKQRTLSPALKEENSSTKWKGSPERFSYAK